MATLVLLITYKNLVEEQLYEMQDDEEGEKRVEMDVEGKAPLHVDATLGLQHEFAVCLKSRFSEIITRSGRICKEPGDKITKSGHSTYW